MPDPSDYEPIDCRTCHRPVPVVDLRLDAGVASVWAAGPHAQRMTAYGECDVHGEVAGRPVLRKS